MATFTNTTFCTIQDVKDTIDSLEVVCNKVRDANFDSYVQKKITLAKNRLLKFDLQKECQRRFPDTIEQWTRFLHDQIDKATSLNSRSVTQSGINEVLPPNQSDFFANPGGYTFNAIYGICPASQVGDPQVRFNSGIPDSSTFANVAKTGSIVIDYNSDDKQFPYINRGTLAVPSWSIMNAKDGIDFILNPDCLINCACYATLLLMSKDGIFANRVNFQDDRFTMTAESMFADHYDEAKYGRLSDDKKKRIGEGDFSLVDWDIDGDGIISDYEKSVNVENSNAPAIW